MHRFATERVAIYQATGIRRILRIILDNLTLKHTEKDFTKRQTVCMCLLIGMVGDPYAVVVHSINDVADSALGMVDCLR